MIARTPEKFEEAGIRVRLNTPVDAIDAPAGEVRLAGGERLPYDRLVMATGAAAVMPDVEGVDEAGVFVLRNLRDAMDIKAYIREKGCRKVLIVGAGFIAMEMSEGLAAIGVETAIVYRGKLPVRRWDPEFGTMVLSELEGHAVSFLPERTLQGIERGADGRLRMHTSGGTLEGDIILLALGVRPDTVMAEQAGCALGETGAIGVDEHLRTSQEGIYAAGDCCEAFHRVANRWVHVSMGDVANKQGRIAGRNIAGMAATFPGIVGAQSFKVFDLELGATGLDEAGARRAGFDPASAIVWGGPIANSLNVDKKKLGLKLVADRATGKLLGAQAIGNGGAVGRINTLSACLWAGMTLEDVALMDLAYAPPFGGAWDLVHIGAQVLKRKLP